MEKMALDLSSSSLPSALAYVGLSRVTSLKGLFLLGFHASSIKADERAKMEMTRLRSLLRPRSFTANNDRWGLSKKNGKEAEPASGEGSGEPEAGRAPPVPQLPLPAPHLPATPGPALGKAKDSKKKSKPAIASKLASVVKGASSALQKSIRGRGSKASGPPAGFEALGPQILEAGQCIAQNFVMSGKCDFNHFRETRLPAMRDALKQHEGPIRALIATLRVLRPFSYEDLPKGTKKEESVEKKLYQCLSSLLRPVSTTGTP